MRSAFVALACLTLSAGCDAITGVGSLVEGSGDAGAETGTPDATLTPDAPATTDAPSPSDGMPISGDGATDASPTPVDAACATCSGNAPSGWTPVGYAASRSAACPAGFTTIDMVKAPTASNACTCAACSIATPPSCSDTPITTRYGSGAASCTGSGVVVATPNACEPVSGVGVVVAGAIELDRPLPAGGSCAPVTAQLDAAKVGSTPVRLCQPCATGTCGQPPGGAFAACIESAGVALCPATFPSLHRVGTGVSGSCPDCDCAAGGTCGGTVTYYENGNCGGGGGAYTATIDGNCDLTPGLYVDMPVAAYTWNPTVVPTCSSTPRAPTLALTGEVTVCCP